ncbi:Iron-regulated protein A precursor [Caenispirillum salinarum AK4]|uniref:Iron-regulated protein A n=1 Tax=Caenispirillum salinarum AK4 TaxID=1238182 RepID=K9GW53_9PROT|nr:imelysin family protein [Caenispirillum salinarum]EKV29482.1 Iron-regulated protein A precursor [Caenispirillum salinarum AK4]
MKTLATAGAAAILLAAASAAPAQAAPPAAADVVATYADMAHAKYEDSLKAAQDLDAAIDALVESPSEETLAAARKAWVSAREPYQQSEVYRFGNPIVDAWEGRVNAWPLDEGLIDYVAAAYGDESAENAAYSANVIANPTLTLSGEQIDASAITKTLLSDTLHEADGVEANVATGYHAVEFLLWGQDLNGTGPGAGARPATDFDPANCTGGNCERRIAYLTTASELLIDDLKEMVAAWAPGGEARAAVADDPTKGLAMMVTGMGSLSYGELAGERMKLGLMLHDPEEEHDCFSDNTHYSHYFNAKGIQNVYHGRYTRIDGTVVTGPALADLVEAKDPAVHKDMTTRLAATMDAMGVLVDTAQGGEAYDQMLGAENPEGNAKIQAAVDALTAQTRSIEQVVAAAGLGGLDFEGSDSLDAPEKVFE